MTADNEIERHFLEMFLEGDAKEILSGEFVLFDEAVIWIAFGSYSWPATGPQNIAQFLVQADFKAWEDEQSNEIELKFEFARDQLFAAIENGRIIVVGKQTEEEEVDRVEERKALPIVELYTLISAELLREGGWSETARCYQIGPKRFDGLFVRKHDLDQVFGPLKRSPGISAKTNASNTNQADQSASSDAIPRQRGRRVKWDWDLIIFKVAYLIGQHGNIPETQADLERLIAELFQDEFGDEPSSSMIRAKASPLFERLRRKSR